MQPDTLESQPLIKSKSALKEPKGFLGYSLTDILAMVFTLMVGMMIFSGVFWLASFRMHYKNEDLAYTLMAVVGGLVLFLAWFAFKRLTMTSDGATDHFAVWAGTLAIIAFTAYFGGLYCGWKNFVVNMNPYYEMADMNNYRDVDPSTMSGGAFMDAGTINFVRSARLDLSKSSGFMNLDMYCVAPIVSDSPQKQWDFWAVGINCCTGAPNNFACGSAVHEGTKGGYGGARGGLRLMSVSSLPFFQMAVTQAQTRYMLNSSRPLFLHWVKDAHKSLEEYKSDGWTNFKISCTAALCCLSLLLFLGSAFVAIVKSKYK